MQSRNSQRTSVTYSRVVTSDGQTPLRVGISECLLGTRVRYDGGHKRSDPIIFAFGEDIELVPVCPEVGIGLGTPREPLRLERDRARVRMRGVGSRTDRTAAMEGFAASELNRLEESEISGWILKSRSPSCGLSVGIHGGGHAPGIFAKALTERWPHLPVAEETDLETAEALHAFVERVFAYRRVRWFLRKERTAGQLAMFNAQRSLQLASHSAAKRHQLAQLVAAAASIEFDRWSKTYLALFMDSMSVVPTSESHAGALGEALERLDSGQDRSHTANPYEAILAVSRLAGEAGDRFLMGQTYLNPEPGEDSIRRRLDQRPLETQAPGSE